MLIGQNDFCFNTLSAVIQSLSHSSCKKAFNWDAHR
jgi:hypothetical protein